MSNASPSVIILLLNWNGWRDTIECLESVFRLNYPSYRVVVCDNGSSDESLRHIEAWAEGKAEVVVSAAHPMHYLTSPPVEKPIAYTGYTRAHIESGAIHSSHSTKLTLIQTGRNLGFAGGNNVGLRYALACGAFDYIWLLNSDTVVLPDALTHLVETAEADRSIGLCGSTILYYHHPSLIQTLGGGRYQRWFGLTSHIAEGECIEALSPAKRQQLASEMEYVMGASMLVSRDFLETIGLMSEAYFLYFEELDWAMRAKGRFKLGYAEKSIVYHKGGQSVGNTLKEWSATSVFYSTQSRIKFVRKFYPHYLPLVYLRLVLSLANQWRKGKHAQANAIWEAIKREAKRNGR